MNKAEIQAAETRLEAMRVEDKQFQETLAAIGDDLAVAEARLRAAELEFNTIQREFQEGIRGLRADQKAHATLLANTLEERRTLKRAYGTLFEQVGLAKRALEREASKSESE